MTGADRVAQWLEKKKASGAKRTSILLCAEALEKLESLRAIYPGESQGSIINWVIMAQGTVSTNASISTNEITPEESKIANAPAKPPSAANPSTSHGPRRRTSKQQQILKIKIAAFDEAYPENATLKELKAIYKKIADTLEKPPTDPPTCHGVAFDGSRACRSCHYEKTCEAALLTSRFQNTPTTVSVQETIQNPLPDGFQPVA